MLEMFGNLLDMIVPVSEVLMPALWMCFGVYAGWYIALAKKYVPLTVEEARLLWEVHKKRAECEAKKWQKIMRKNRMIGFECGCGYKHTQKRPII